MMDKNFVEKNNKRVFLIILWLIIFFNISIQLFGAQNIGMADNGDFLRTSEPCGITYSNNPWLIADSEKTDFHKYYNTEFKYIEPVKAAFYTSASIPILASRVISELFYSHTKYSLKALGAVYTFFYMVCVSIIFYILYMQREKITLAIALFFLIFFSDAYIVQYFKSFYSEPAALLYLLLGLSLYVAFYCTDSLFIKMKYTYFVKLITSFLEISCFILFGISKLQYMPIAYILIVFSMVQFYMWLKKLNMNKKKVITLSALICITVTTCFTLLVGLSVPSEGSYFRWAGTYNVVMQDMLAMSDKPEQHLMNMGISEEGIEELKGQIGTNYYTGDKDIANKYVEHFTRKNQVKIFVTEPQLVFKLIKLKGESLFNYNEGLGNFSRETAKEPYEKSSYFRGLSALMSKIPHNIWSFIILVFSSVVIILRRLFQHENKMKYIDILFGVILLVSIANFMMSVVGDCHHDDIKHLFLTNVLLELIFAYIVAYIASFIYVSVTKFAKKK